MSRTRISTTVDSDRLNQARQLLDLPDSQLVDRALEALLAQAEARRERQALLRHPYDDDEQVAWSAGPTEPLPYDGDIPDEVAQLARERRAQYGKG